MVIKFKDFLYEWRDFIYLSFYWFGIWSIVLSITYFTCDTSLHWITLLVIASFFGISTVCMMSYYYFFMFGSRTKTTQ